MTERVGCSWLREDRDTSRARRDYPDSAAWHDSHGDDFSKCDSWLCVCGRTDSRGGSWEYDEKSGNVTCTECGRVYDRTGLAIGRPGAAA